MNQRQPIALVVHGHFYQPPRENPWTDEVPREPSAAPFPNWNARIHAECYRANAYARIYHSKDLIGSIVNNYAALSFNVGPTLARWIERHDRHVMRRMREGDAAQMDRLSAGGAMAQVWGHPITPLLSEHDRRTQILWGLYDFQRRFGHAAAGIWLPETAANPASLAALIDAGITYTILAPEQVEAVRAPDGEWEEVDKDTVDTGRAYRFLHPDGSGRSLAIAIFDGPLSRDLAFGGATRDAASFLEAMRRSAERSKVEDKPLVLAASDGELYGHHKKFADLALAYAVSVSAPADGIEVTNLGAYLAQKPPTWDVRLRPGPDGEGTAWSCAHGVGRWRRDCGCRMDHAKGGNQSWRGPLRKALDLLRDRSNAFFEDAADDLFADPWEARNAYGMVADDDADTRKLKLRSIGKSALRNDRGKLSTRALMLMEMQRSLLLMYASCAWFFDDIAGVEPAIALRRAAHAMDLWAELGGRPPTKAFLDILAEARSNDRKLGTGADAFARACKDRVTPERAVARSAFSCLASMASGENQVPGFDVMTNCPSTQAPPRVLRGKATVTERRNGLRTTLDFSASHDGKADFQCQIGKDRLSIDDLDDEAAQALRLGAMVRMAADCHEASGCKALLEVADGLATCTSGEQVALAGLLARALATFLEARFDGKKARMPQTDWLLALELADRAGTMQPTDDWRRVQEIVWEHLALLREQGKPIPKALQALAERLEMLKAPDAKEDEQKAD
jgi:alpha-amylase/alpha-mannosidase (GH57 family)